MDADRTQLLQKLNWSGKITDEEFTQAKAAFLAGTPLDGRLAEVLLQAELARLDQEWEAERANYMVRFKQARFLPTKGTSVFFGVLMVATGVIWTTGVARFGDNGLGVQAWPILGVGFTLMWLAFSVLCYLGAVKYEQAHAAYQQRRERLISRALFGAEHIPDR